MNARDAKDYIANFDWSKLRDIDMTSFGVSAADSPFKTGDTIEVSGFYADRPLPRRFDGYTSSGMDSPKIKRGVKVEMHNVSGVSGTGIVTGRYKQRDGRVHFWGYINEATP